MAKQKDLTLKQVAEHFGVSLSTAKQWLRDKGFPAARLEETILGSVWLIPMTDVEKFKRPAIGRPVGKRKKRRTKQ